MTMGAGPTKQTAEGHLVPQDDAGTRVDRYIQRCWPDVPHSHVQKLIRAGKLRVNGVKQAPNYRLQMGDVLYFPVVWRQNESVHSPPDKGGSAASCDARLRSLVTLAHRLPILHEDVSLIALDKPAGVAVHGGSGVSSGVIERLRAARPKLPFLELVHRLDRETSGVLLIAKKRVALAGLHEQWRARSVEKRYVVIVRGEWSSAGVSVLDFPLFRAAAPDGDRRVFVCEEGQEARTLVRVLKRFSLPFVGKFSLLEAVIKTGRTHQIRVHLAHAGYPIVGDDKYGDFSFNRRMGHAGFRRMYLHAAMLGFRHPQLEERFVVRAPIPLAFEQMVKGVVEVLP